VNQETFSAALDQSSSFSFYLISKPQTQVCVGL